MAHEIESMAYTGEAPWHGLGTKIDHLMTAREAIVAAKLDWTVTVEDAYVKRGDGFVNLEGHKFIKRDSDDRVLGRCSRIYTPIQNFEAFDFADSVVGTKEAVYETAGSLRNGERIWLLMNLKNHFSIKGEEISPYLTLTNSHDGYNACQMFFTPVRVVCMNTLKMAMSGAGKNCFYARHTTNIKEKLAEAQQVLGIANKFFADWKEKADAMALKQLPPAQMPLLLQAAFETSGSLDASKVYAPTQIKFDKVLELVEVGRGMDNPAIKGTVWQAYNALVEYVDYYEPYRSKAEDARLQGSWFGRGNDIKNRAWNFCLNQL